MNRRDFLSRCFWTGIGLCAGPLAISALEKTSPQAVSSATSRINLKEALWYERGEGGATTCTLCPNRCVRSPGENGKCRSRGNRGGKYYSLTYNRPCIIALDEVEKCPLHHFQTKAKAFSIATAGCNLFCRYCQNWNFSQAGPDDVPRSYNMTPEEIIAKAIENQCDAISFFYTEPVVYYEYMLDIARLARARGLKTIMVTAGYISPEPLRACLPYMDAVTMGLKGWNEKFYREIIGGELGCVKETIRELARAKNVWWEAVTLIIPTLNDSQAEIAGMAKWLRETAGDEIPLHFTRFRPEYQMKRLPMTPMATLTNSRDTARRQGLKYVYVDNMPGHEGSHTYCPKCGRMVIERVGFKVLNRRLSGGRCEYCQYPIKGVWL